MVDFFSRFNSNEWITLFGALGNWLSAFGTLVAVIVAIWLARHSEKEKIKVYAGNRATFGEGQSVDCFAIGITNIGPRTVTIHSASFWVGKRKNGRIAIIPESLSSMPRTIEYGETSLILISYEEYPDWKKNLVADIIEDRPLRTPRLHITTTVGYAKKVKLEDGFLADLKQMQDELRTQSKTKVK